MIVRGTSHSPKASISAPSAPAAQAQLPSVDQHGAESQPGRSTRYPARSGPEQGEHDPVRPEGYQPGRGQVRRGRPGAPITRTSTIATATAFQKRLHQLGLNP